MPGILRLTLFKLTDASHVQDAVDIFSTLTQDALKDGEPYILAANGIPTYDDPRNQGYNFATRMMFQSKEDMDYYDKECAAHEEIKRALKSKVAGPPLVLYADAAAFMDKPVLPN